MIPNLATHTSGLFQEHEAVAGGGGGVGLREFCLLPLCRLTEVSSKDTSRLFHQSSSLYHQ